jgi:uncharacterized alkaline shock family protein YloU
MSDKKNESGDIGGVFVAPEVIVTYISGAVTETPGVAALAGNISDTITKKILGNESKFKGIKIDGGEFGYTIDIFIIVNYGERIPDVAWNVQKNVKASLDGVMDIIVENINIHVQGVRKESDEAGGNAPDPGAAQGKSEGDGE